MSEDDIWRSNTAYDYVDQLTPSEIAWEFLRRNPDYQESYRQLVSSGRLSEEVAKEVAQRWGLRFRRRPSCNGAYPTDLLDPANQSCGYPTRCCSCADRGRWPHR